MPKRATARVDPEPWLIEKQAQMRAEQETQIYLLVTIREARWLADGMVSEALADQAALAVEERT
jgi:hypothetical protein